MKIAILGGSFDPPHIGHKIIAKQMRKDYKFDQVWLLPCCLHAFSKPLTAPTHRLNMAKMLKEKNIKVSDYEIKRGGISLSIETLIELSKIYPKHKFSWIIGSDQVKDFPKWEGWEEIINVYGLIIAKRIPNISSTIIRRHVKQKKPISHLVPKSVERYIKKHKLYV